MRISLHTDWFRTGHRLRQTHTITTDVEQRPTAGISLVTHITGFATLTHPVGIDVENAANFTGAHSP